MAPVLAAFMGGLACGSFFMGRLASRFERFHPLRLYAVMEVLIALVGILIPLALHSLVPIYQFVWKATHASFLTFSIILCALRDCAARTHVPDGGDLASGQQRLCIGTKTNWPALHL